MKRIGALLLVVAFAGVMLLPVASHVNLVPGNHVQIADGGGGAPPVPPWPTMDSSGSLASTSRT
jgi:hypothetical protein